MAGRSDLPFVGAVLTGGASRRMGADKALLEVHGVTLVRRVADALTAAGADRVVAVGGDIGGLRSEGLEAVPDQHPGEGPLGGILTALAATDADVVVVLACDLPAADPAAITAVVEALGQADVAAPWHDGRHELLHAAWHRRAERPLQAAFAAGERAPRRAVSGLTVVSVTGLDPAALADADTPEELP
jgi:molybdopterin-guanine dinucleotide biosynthesis protein A